MRSAVVVLGTFATGIIAGVPPICGASGVDVPPSYGAGSGIHAPKPPKHGAQTFKPTIPVVTIAPTVTKPVVTGLPAGSATLVAPRVSKKTKATALVTPSLVDTGMVPDGSVTAIVPVNKLTKATDMQMPTDVLMVPDVPIATGVSVATGLPVVTGQASAQVPVEMPTTFMLSILPTLRTGLNEPTPPVANVPISIPTLGSNAVPQCGQGQAFSCCSSTGDSAFGTPGENVFAQLLGGSCDQVPINVIGANGILLNSCGDSQAACCHIRHGNLLDIPCLPINL